MTQPEPDLSFMYEFPKYGTRLDSRVGYEWVCGVPNETRVQFMGVLEPGMIAHQHSLTCLYIWHYCTLILGEGTIAPGKEYGWRPSGVRSHDLVSVSPLTIAPSILWAGCCDLHGFLQDDTWVQA